MVLHLVDWSLRYFGVRKRSSTNTFIHASSFLLAKHLEPQPIGAKLLLPIIRSLVHSFGCSFAVLFVHFFRFFDLANITFFLKPGVLICNTLTLVCVHHAAHSPDNSFLGFVVSGPIPEHIKPQKKKPIGLVYGKDVEFWAVSISSSFFFVFVFVFFARGSSRWHEK